MAKIQIIMTQAELENSREFTAAKQPVLHLKAEHSINQNEGSHKTQRGGFLHKTQTTMAKKTKKMTIKYWNELSDGAQKRALTYVFPIHPAIVEMLMNEKPDLKSDWWKMVFTKVRIPGPGSYYKTVVNNTYLN